MDSSRYWSTSSNITFVGKTYPIVLWPGVGLEYDGSDHFGFRDVLDRKKRWWRRIKKSQKTLNCRIHIESTMVVIGTRSLREAKQGKVHGSNQICKPFFPGIFFFCIKEKYCMYTYLKHFLMPERTRIRIALILNFPSAWEVHLFLILCGNHHHDDRRHNIIFLATSPHCQIWRRQNMSVFSEYRFDNLVSMSESTSLRQLDPSMNQEPHKDKISCEPYFSAIS